MTKDPKEILIQILIIVAYKDDKNSFAEKFIVLCQQQAFLEFVESLPKTLQDDLKEKFADPNDKEKIKKAMNQYVSTKEFLEKLELVTAKNFKEYIEAIIPTLNDEQKANLQKYLISLSP